MKQKADRGEQPKHPVRGLAAAAAMILALAASSTVSGCGTRSSKETPPESLRERSVAQRVVLPENSSTYQRKPDENYVMPVPLPDNPLPAYPGARTRIPQDTTVLIAVTLVIDEEGRVVDVRPREPYEADARAAYFQEVDRACRKWRFTPLQVKTTSVVPDGQVFDLPKVKVVTDVRSLPFSLDYEFHFSDRGVVNGIQKMVLEK